MALAVTSNGNFAYVVNNGSSTVTAFSISSAGALTNLGSVSTGAGLNPVAVSVDPAGAFVYVVNQSGSIVTYPISTTGTLGTPTLVNIGNAPVQLVTAARQ